MPFPQPLDTYLLNSPLERAEASMFQNLSSVHFQMHCKGEVTPAQTSCGRPELQQLQRDKLAQTVHKAQKNPPNSESRTPY